MIVFRNFCVFVPFRQRRCFEYLEDQYRVMGGQRTARLCDDIGLWKVVFGTDIDQCPYRVVYVFLYRIVHAALTCRRAGTVVVDPQASTYIDKFDVIPHLVELHIKLRCFAQCVFDEAYFGNLAAYVEVNEFEAVFHFILFENIESFEQFARVESEFADISSRVFPFSASRAGQFDADSYVGADFQSFGNRCDEMQFV